MVLGLMFAFEFVFKMRVVHFIDKKGIYFAHRVGDGNVLDYGPSLVQY
jgi:hypothetical protein